MTWSERLLWTWVAAVLVTNLYWCATGTAPHRRLLEDDPIGCETDAPTGC